MPTSDGLITARDLCTGAVQERTIADGAITAPKIASGLAVPVVVSSLPVDAAEGDLAYLTTDKKVYRYDGSAWIVEVDGGDIKASSILAGSIAAGAIGADQLAANSVIAGKIAADAIVADNIVAKNITTAKINDQAVGVAQQLDPVFTSSGTANGSNSPSLTSSWQTTASWSMSVDSWVGTLNALGIGNATITNNGSGSSYGVQTLIGGTAASQQYISVPTGNTHYCAAAGRRLITSPGSSITFAVQLQRVSGTGTTNIYASAVPGIATGVR